MELTVLAVPDCPNAPLLEERLADVLAGRPGVRLTRRVIADEGEAARWGMQGSPTLLVDGMTRSPPPARVQCWGAGCTRPWTAGWRARRPWPHCGRRSTRPNRQGDHPPRERDLTG